MTLIKICGVCRAQDAAVAVAAGADAVGVVLAPGRRRLSLDEAEDALAAVPARVARVGVFVDADPAFVAEATRRLRLDYAQFHGSETPDACADAPVPVIKAFKVGPEFDAAQIESYEGVIAFALLDTQVDGEHGGAGVVFDWDRVPPLPEDVPVLVAGGLHPGNVAQAIRTLRPAGVDVSSGVEARLREKDPERVREFCAAVRATDQEVDVS
jgi:phosphoribosylanthranilate isomerase